MPDIRRLGLFVNNTVDREQRRIRLEKVLCRENR